MFVRLASTGVFIVSGRVLSLLWQLSFHWLIHVMGKGKIGLCCYFTVDILIKNVQKCFFFQLLSWQMNG